MDFERMGMAIGYAKTIRNLEAAATREILKGNATIEELSRTIVAERRHHAAEVTRLQREIRVLRGEPEPVIAIHDRRDTARDAHDAVMAEPVRFTRFLGCRRVWWRRDEYRTVRGAERARARAARDAYDDLMAGSSGSIIS